MVENVSTKHRRDLPRFVVQHDVEGIDLRTLLRPVKVLLKNELKEIGETNQQAAPIHDRDLSYRKFGRHRVIDVPDGLVRMARPRPQAGPINDRSLATYIFNESRFQHTEDMFTVARRTPLCWPQVGRG